MRFSLRYRYYRLKQFVRELLCKHEWHYINFSFISYYKCAKCNKRG